MMLRMKRQPTLFIVIAALLSGCASVPGLPYSEFYGRASNSAPNIHNVRLELIDGVVLFDNESTVAGAIEYKWLEPGRHNLYVKADMPGNHELRKLTIEVKPCTRYTFVAKDADSTWEAVNTGVSAVPRCKVE